MMSLEAVCSQLLMRDDGESSGAEAVALPDTYSANFVRGLVDWFENEMCTAAWRMMGIFRTVMKVMMDPPSPVCASTLPESRDELLFEAYTEFEYVLLDAMSALDAVERAFDLLDCEDLNLRLEMRLMFKMTITNNIKPGALLAEQVRDVLRREQERAGKLENQVEELSQALEESTSGESLGISPRMQALLDLGAEGEEAFAREAGKDSIEYLIQQCTAMDQAFIDREESITERIIFIEGIAAKHGWSVNPVLDRLKVDYATDPVVYLEKLQNLSDKLAGQGQEACKDATGDAEAAEEKEPVVRRLDFTPAAMAEAIIEKGAPTPRPEEPVDAALVEAASKQRPEEAEAATYNVAIAHVSQQVSALESLIDAALGEEAKQGVYMEAKQEPRADPPPPSPLDTTPAPVQDATGKKAGIETAVLAVEEMDHSMASIPLPITIPILKEASGEEGESTTGNPPKPHLLQASPRGSPDRVSQGPMRPFRTKAKAAGATGLPAGQRAETCHRDRDACRVGGCEFPGTGDCCQM